MKLTELFSGWYEWLQEDCEWASELMEGSVRRCSMLFASYGIILISMAVAYSNPDTGASDLDLILLTILGALCFLPVFKDALHWND